MASYLVRAEKTYSVIVEADSEEDAIMKAPELPDAPDPWESSDTSWEAEKN